MKKQNAKSSFPILFGTWLNELLLNVTYTQICTSRKGALLTKGLDTELCRFGLKGLSRINYTVTIVSVLRVSLLNNQPNSMSEQYHQTLIQRFPYHRVNYCFFNLSCRMSFTNYITSQIKREIKLIGVSDSVALCKLTPAKDLFNVTFLPQKHCK